MATKNSKAGKAANGEKNNAELRTIAAQLIRARDDEEMSMLTLKLALMHGDAEAVLGVPKIERHRFEVTLGEGRADLVLFHKDGGVSLVEVKADSSVRSVVAGIGQLCLYESELPKAFKGKAQQPKYIRKVLASPVAPEKATVIIHACAVADVQYASLARYGDLQSALCKLGWKHGA